MNFREILIQHRAGLPTASVLIRVQRALRPLQIDLPGLV